MQEDRALVLRCELCNKPFDKQSTYKRHGYYCRSLKIGNTTRLRSCVACAKSKARCDTQRPKCSRCSAKSIECDYPAPARRRAERVATIAPQGEHPPQAPITPESDGNLNVAFDHSLIVPDLNVDDFDWDYNSMGFPDLPVLEENMDGMMEGLVPNNILTPDTSLVPRAVSPYSSTVQTPPFNFSPTSNLVIPPVPSATRRSLVLRSKSRPGPQRAVTLILHMLKSYPQMMLRDSVLPPYIHPYLVSDDFSGHDMEFLHNCVSLMRMTGHSMQGSRKLFWKNVKLECERIVVEATKMNNWQLLAAMHALSIYILLRMSEGETEHNNFVHLLLTTMTATAKQLTLSDLIYTPTSHTSDTHACWLDWLYMESRRRLGVVFRVINLIVYFDPGAMCSLQSDLLVAPLPSKKVLWEAPDALTWKAERDKQPVPRPAFGLTTTGGMVRLDEMDLHGGYGTIDPMEEISTSEQNWEEWLSGIDAFGGLIVLAASLIG